MNSNCPKYNTFSYKCFIIVCVHASTLFSIGYSLIRILLLCVHYVYVHNYTCARISIFMSVLIIVLCVIN